MLLNPDSSLGGYHQWGS